MKTKSKTQTGWIIRNIETGRFLNRLSKSKYTSKLENAVVYGTRTTARSNRVVGEDTVMKVSIRNNRPTKILAGNGSNCKF